MKSGKMNFLEPSGTIQACNGTAFPLPYMLVTEDFFGDVQVRVKRISASKSTAMRYNCYQNANVLTPMHACLVSDKYI